MLESIAILLLCQLIGELIVIFLNIPVPGPVIGMILLFIGLVIFGEIPKKLSDTANGFRAAIIIVCTCRCRCNDSSNPTR